MRLFVDAHFLVKQPKGVANFMLNALLALSEYSDIEIYLLSHKRLNDAIQNRLEGRPNIYFEVHPLRLLPNIGTLWFVFYLPYLIRKLNCGFLWSGTVSLPFFISDKTKTIITIHDVVFWKYPQTMGFVNRIISLIFHDYSIKRADYIWSVSNYTRHELESRPLKRMCKSIFVGSSIDFAKFMHREVGNDARVELFSRLGISGDFIIFVGTLEPRKNLSFLLQLMPEIIKRNPSLSLVVVGGKGWGETKLSQIISTDGYPRDKVIFPGYISDDDLVLLYNLASCFVSTSLNEGFGLPQLEAMACYCPVVTADNSAMSEVVSDAGVLVHGWDEKEWVDKILWAIDNKATLLAEYPSKLADYQWDEIIKELLLYIKKYDN